MAEWDELDKPLVTYFNHRRKKEWDISMDDTYMSSLTMKPSGNFVCIPDRKKDPAIKNELNIVNLSDLGLVKLPINVASAIVDPSEKHLAYRIGRTIWIVELGTQLQESYSQYGVDNDPVIITEEELHNLTIKSKELGFSGVFLKWLSKDMMVIVSEDAVYHWVVFGDEDPVKVFDRHADLDKFYIADYETDPQRNWMALTAHPCGHRYNAKIQLVNANRGETQIFVGQAATFTEFQMEGNVEFSTLFCYAAREPEDLISGKLYVMEVGTPPGENAPFGMKEGEIPFEEGYPFGDDFTAGIVINQKLGVVYVINMMSDTHFFDLESLTRFLSHHNAPIFYPIPNIAFTMPYKSGITGVCRGGWMFSYSIDESRIVSYLIKKGNSILAKKMAKRNNWTGAQDLFVGKRY